MQPLLVRSERRRSGNRAPWRWTDPRSRRPVVVDRRSWLPQRLEVTDASPAQLLEPEGLTGASCPAIQLVRSAIAAATDDVDQRTWRRAVAATHIADAQLQHAEACMRHSGVWPWAYRSVSAGGGGVDR